MEYEPKDGKEKTKNDLAQEAVSKACLQLISSTDFKKPRMEKIARYWHD
jgi:hypothetical protein